MSERSKMAEQLLAHAAMCQRVASQCWNEEIAIELEKLGQDCQKAALACEPENAQQSPSVLRH